MVMPQNRNFMGRLYYKIDVIKERIDEWKIKQDGIICIGNNIREVRKSGMKQM